MYKPGDIVYCTKSEWSNDKGISFFNPPKYGDEVVVQEVKMHKGQQLLQLRNQPPQVFYPAKHFRSIQHLFTDTVIDSLAQTRSYV